MNRKNTLTSLSALTLASLAGTLLAGPLSPPAGPVASTMKTITEVEPRIAINATNTPGDTGSTFKITQSGSYYLTADVVALANKVGISVTASNVTIDLNGFGITSSAGAAQAAIEKTSSTGSLSVRNGFMQGPFGNKAVAAGSSAQIEDLAITQGQIAISGSPSGVRRCRITGGGFFPLIALYGSENASSVIEDCQLVHTSSTGDGIVSFHKDSTIRGCTVTSNSAFDNNAILVQAPGHVIEDCTVRGFLAGVNGGSVVKNCTISGVVGSGIFISDAIVEGNRLFNCGTGINVVSGSSALVLANRFRGCTTPILGSGNGIAPTSTAQAATNPNANIAN
jgi:hypothetical protein